MAMERLVMRRSGDKVKNWQKMLSAIAIWSLPSTVSKDVIQSEWDRQPEEYCSNSEHGGQFKFQMIQRGDFIKPGWWHWRCRREDGAGNVAYGYVQADSLGRAITPETFENDR